MTIEITSVAAPGKISEERLVMKATSNDNMTNYIVLQGRSAGNDDVYSGDIDRAYWFATRKVNTGDFVVLYTKSGTNSEKKNKDGTTSYFFYWGLTSPIWVSGQAPALLRAPSWQIGKAIK